MGVAGGANTACYGGHARGPAIAIVGDAFDDGPGAVHQGADAVHAVEHIVEGPGQGVVVHHQPLVDFAAACLMRSICSGGIGVPHSGQRPLSFPRRS